MSCRAGGELEGQRASVSWRAGKLKVSRRAEGELES